jgi:hypothetical protein
MKRTSKHQDELDFLFNLKYGTDFNKNFTSDNNQADICQALWDQHKDIDCNYIAPREALLDSRGWTDIAHIDETPNEKILSGWTYQSNNENSNIEKVHFKFWSNCETPAMTTWIVSYIKLKNDDCEYYGPHFHFWNRAEADRYIKFIKKLFTKGWTTKKITSESLIRFGL